MEFRSPLVETNFSKLEIRKSAKLLDYLYMINHLTLVWHQEFHGVKGVTAEKLSRIEFGETIVKQLTKIKQVRVRDLNGSAKIEVDKKMISVFDNEILESNY